MADVIADEQILYHSPDSDGLYCYTPWLDHGFNGRIFASFDISGDALPKEEGPKSDHGDHHGNQLRIYASDDNGKSWQEKTRLPMLHARVFTAGKTVYALGHSHRLSIAKSQDNGETWSEVFVLDDTVRWHQSSGSYERHNGRIYITMEHVPHETNWAGGDPVLMSANENDDLTKAENWTFSNKMKFSDTVELVAPPAGKKPYCWLESSVVFQRDENNIFYDETFKSMLVFLRVNRGRFPDQAMILRGTEKEDGSLELSTLKDSDGNTVLYTCLPGAYMKFQIIWDEPAKLYWLIASRSRMTTFSKMENMPSFVQWFDERRRLELFYSKNLFDWCSAGVVAQGNTEVESRHYASLLPAGDDLLVLSRSGDADTKNSHETNMITLHRVKNFRSLSAL